MLVKLASLLVGACAATWLLGCVGGGSGPPRPDDNPGLPPAVSLAPENTGDGWVVSTPESEGLDARALSSALELIRSGRYPGVDAVVVARNQRLVAEGYFNGFGRESMHDLRSTGKSVTSALVGIAVGQGLLNLDEPVSRHLPGFEEHLHMNDAKRSITARHLLHMHSGLDCDDWNRRSPGAEDRMYRQRDWVGFTLDQRMAHAPGTVPAYCTGGVVILGHLLSLRAAQPLDAYAQTWLFDPLRISRSDWRRAPDGTATGGGGLRLRPRDAAKFGALFANEGVWNGVRVIPEDWVHASRQQLHVLGADGYGYLWWKRRYAHRTGPVQAVFTSGNGGNFIFTIPALELVVVFTGSNYNHPRSDQPFQMLPHFLAAVP